MDKASQTITVFGTKIPKYQDCLWCKAPLACAFTSFAYSQPCDSCKNTPKYDAQMKENKKPGITEAFKNQQVAGVWQGKGRTFYTNHKGNVIRDEPYRPLPRGKKDWK